MNEKTLGALLLDFEVLVAATELDDLLLVVVAVLDDEGVLDFIELATLLAVDDAGVDEVLAPHKVPFTLGAPAVPFA